MVVFTGLNRYDRDTRGRDLIVHRVVEHLKAHGISWLDVEIGKPMYSGDRRADGCLGCFAVLVRCLEQGRPIEISSQLATVRVLLDMWPQSFLLLKRDVLSIDESIAKLEKKRQTKIRPEKLPMIEASVALLWHKELERARAPDTMWSQGLWPRVTILADDFRGWPTWPGMQRGDHHTEIMLNVNTRRMELFAIPLHGEPRSISPI